MRLVSVCCEAPPTDEITDGAGRCSRCKENAMFEPDTWNMESEEGPCKVCRGEVGHRINCPKGIASSNA